MRNRKGVKIYSNRYVQASGPQMKSSHSSYLYLLQYIGFEGSF